MVVGYVSLVALNLITLFIGPERVLLELNLQWWGTLVSVIDFDSWGTVGGLLGIVVLFVPVVLGWESSRRKGLSLFFLGASVAVGVVASVAWNALYNHTGVIGAGSSSIAIAAQGMVFALALFGLGGLFRGKQLDGDYYFFAAMYLTIVVSTLYFVLVLQPIFVPSPLYNWRVHEFGFILGALAAAVYITASVTLNRHGERRGKIDRRSIM